MGTGPGSSYTYSRKGGRWTIGVKPVADWIAVERGSDESECASDETEEIVVSTVRRCAPNTTVVIQERDVCAPECAPEFAEVCLIACIVPGANSGQGTSNHKRHKRLGMPTRCWPDHQGRDLNGEWPLQRQHGPEPDLRRSLTCAVNGILLRCCFWHLMGPAHLRLFDIF